MDTSDATAFVNLVTAEMERRRKLLPEDDDGTAYAYDRWMFTDLPFLHDLCLLYLVALRHHIERRLFFFAVCATRAGKPIKKATFYRRQRELKKKGWKEIARRLKPDGAVHYASVEGLRLLANSYKHDPRKEPGKDLIKYLKLNQRLTYAEIPESGELQKGLSRLVGLPDAAGYAEITERFGEHADAFLKDIETRNKLSKVKWGMVSLIKFAH